MSPPKYLEPGLPGEGNPEQQERASLTLPPLTHPETVQLHNWNTATNPSLRSTLAFYQWLKARLALMQHVAEQETGKAPLFAFAGGHWPDNIGKGQG